MALKKGQLIELEITQLAFGGRGLTRVDGLAVFVDGAVPGDKVLARIGRKKKSFAEARLLQLLEPSRLRVPPPCPHSPYCGGCTWQFLDYGQQLHYKQQHVAESLEHIAGLKEVPVHAVIPSERICGYRNKMEFTFTPRRWLLPGELGQPGIEPGMALGLHVPGTFDKVMDIPGCMLQPELGNRLLAAARAYALASGLPAYHLRTHEGFWRFLVLRHSVDRDCWMVNIVTAAEQREVVQPLADRLREEFPQVVSVVNNITGRRAGVAVGEREVLLSGDPFITDRIGPYEFEISANSFFQTNTRGAGRLYDAVARYAGLNGSERVLDLYCGAGTISIYLSGSAREVIGMELSPTAVADAERNRLRNGIANCRFIAGDIRTRLPALDFRPEVMIIDPPRAGMHPDVVKQVIGLSPDRIVYVSCNPATLARDLSLMKESYTAAEIQPIDMFPHTYHIEAVARLARKS